MHNATTETQAMPATNPDFLTALTAFVANCQQFVTEAHVRQGLNVTCSTLSIAKGGRKYAKIVSSEGGTVRSVYGFVRKEDGAVFKADGWKKPALNFPRGSIYGDFKPQGGWRYSIG